MAEFSSYIASTEKRFQISNDNESRERIGALHNAYKELCKEMPDIPLGFSLFGSLSKGRFLDEDQATRSDIDLIIYADLDNTEEPFEKVKSRILKKLKQKLGIPLFERSFIDIRRISLTGNNSIMNICEETYYTDPYSEPAEEYGTYSEQRIAGFFHLDIGGGLKKYKAEFVKELQAQSANNPIQANSYWEHVYYCTNKTERKNHIPLELKGPLPKTLQEAISYYRV